MTSPGSFGVRPSAAALTLVPADAGEGHVVLMVSGEVDMATSDDLARALTDLLRQRSPRRLLVDLAGVRFLDSSGIQALVVGAQRACHHGCDLALVNVPKPVRRVLEITGVASLLGLGPSAGDDHRGTVSSPDSTR
ncbi:STAS domain-containing protein [Micromonospora sp. NPDC051300]|uniref:STAS domain-containing protein n=1 Tax=Micromonospora sp. NPDC051300 TaxID=3364286 RepID=UPI0037A33EBE